jgi:hypothetical protein
MKSRHFPRWDPALIAVVSALTCSLACNPAQAFIVDDSEESPVEAPVEVDESPPEEVAEPATTETAAPDETQEVAGGTPALPGTYLFNARLELNPRGLPFGRLLCSGTQIRPGWVVTAAHCIQNPSDPLDITPGEIQVRIGATYVRGAQSEIGTVWEVANIFVHPSYHREDFGKADIALLQLVTTDPSQNTGETLRVGVPENSEFYRSQNCPPVFHQIPGGPAWYESCPEPKLDDGLILGWGIIGESMTGKLMTGEMAIWKDWAAPVGHGFWQKWFGPNYHLDERIVASGYASACPGDSGGSLIAFDDDGQPFLVGVTSAAPKGQCKPNERYALFTDVTLGKFQDWIERTINPPPPYNGGGSGGGELPGGSSGEGPGTPRQEQ